MYICHIFAILSYMKRLSLNKPHLIVMVGVPGSGKSFFAEKFAETFGAPYINYEKILQYTSDPSQLESLLCYQLEELLKTGQPIMLEGLSDTRAERLELSRAAKEKGYETLFIWVQTDPTTAKNRTIRETKNKSNRTLSSEEYDRAAKRFTPPHATEKSVVLSGKHTYATQARVVLKKLSEPRAEISAHSAAPIRSAANGRRNITIR